jgi:hypothetical protein
MAIYASIVSEGELRTNPSPNFPKGSLIDPLPKMLGSIPFNRYFRFAQFHSLIFADG